MEQSQIDNT